MRASPTVHPFRATGLSSLCCDVESAGAVRANKCGSPARKQAPVVSWAEASSSAGLRSQAKPRRRAAGARGADGRRGR